MNGLLIILFAVISTLIRGWVFAVLWLWFFVPTFNLPEISIPAAIGMLLPLQMIVWFRKNRDNEEIKLDDAFYAIEFPLVILLVGWVVSLFM